MTVGEITRYFADRTFFTDPRQKVRIVLSPGDVPLEEGTRLELRGSVVPERGEAVVAFQPAPARKYRFALGFEASPVIEAQTPGEAKRKASEMVRGLMVANRATGVEDGGYEAWDPCLLEEVKE